ncbi:hypothetical protein DENSPDRAFT_779191 [Dentipellis sp. KUC8613]|nr:hypothetical protein DENSPDRAFT_779191 [Dentipellis sp. KUC8613]
MTYFPLAALLYYDYFLTLPAEVSRIWSRPTSRAALWFFINRYIPFFGDIAVSVFSFTNLASSDKASFILPIATANPDVPSPLA